MGIQAYFIDKRINKALVDSSKVKNTTDLSRIEKVVILVDENIAFNDAEFVKLQDLMHLDHTRFNIITYKEKKSNFNEFRGTVILPSDINWRGNIISQDVKDTLTHPFDLFIDYTQGENQKKQLIAALIQAKFKVGFSDKMHDLYDFMIDVNPSEISLFNKELVRYLKILKLL